MARPYEYSRSRYILMQVAMWVILLASVGVAALVSRVSRNQTVELGSPVTMDNVSLKLPRGWRVKKDLEEGEPTVFAIERARAPFGREIQIVLHGRGLIDWLTARGGEETAIPFGDAREGVLTIQTSSRGGMEEGGEAETELQRVLILARGSIGERRDVVIVLSTIGENGKPDPADVELVRNVAASVKQLSPGDGPQLRQR